MKKLLVFLLLLVCLGGCQPAVQTQPAEPMRVACLGDSVTYGYDLDRAEAYPAQLQTLLGEGYLVENFGLNGAAVSDYVNTPAFAAARDFAPDVMVIMLGSNDTNAALWQDADAFAAQYELLLDTCEGTGATLILCTCSAAYPVNGTYQFGVDPAALTQVCDVIRSQAADRELRLVDIAAVTEGHPAWYERDGVHPDAAGASAIAEAVADAVRAA